MPKPDSMSVFQEAVEKAMADYAKALEQLAFNTLKKLSLKDPESEFTFVSAMGTWGFDRKGKRQLTMEEDGEVGEIIEEREIEPDQRTAPWKMPIQTTTGQCRGFV